MLSFKKLTLKDINFVKPYFSYSLSCACDNTVGGTFMWRDFFETEYCLQDDTLIFKVKYSGNLGQKSQAFGDLTAFPYPLGADARGSIREIEKYCKSLDIPLVFCAATEEDIAVYRDMYSPSEIISNESWDDYLYKAEDLIDLPGRKYSGQRNHINNFLKLHTDFSFEEITPGNLRKVTDFYKRISSTFTKETRSFREGQEKTLEVLANYDDYGLLGGLLSAGGEVIGFAVGEVLKDTLFIHIERADLRFRGAYQMLAKLFTKHFADKNVIYVNREEDDGDIGLRTAKKAYHPIKMIRKHMVIV